MARVWWRGGWKRQVELQRGRPDLEGAAPDLDQEAHFALSPPSALRAARLASDLALFSCSAAFTFFTFSCVSSSAFPFFSAASYTTPYRCQCQESHGAHVCTGGPPPPRARLGDAGGPRVYCRKAPGGDSVTQAGHVCTAGNPEARASDKCSFRAVQAYCDLCVDRQPVHMCTWPALH